MNSLIKNKKNPYFSATDPAELSAIDREWDYYYYYTFSIMAERAAGGNPCDVCPHWLSPEE